MKIFLDVGAHTGQTLAAVKRWAFDEIVCFEPCGYNHTQLRKVAGKDGRVKINGFGLWDKDISAPLHHAGSQGASLWTRPNRDDAKPQMCQFKRASEWLRKNTGPGDVVWMKINAEGAELDIITELLDTQHLELVSFMLVMWDAHKIPEIAGRLAEVRSRVEGLYRPPRVMNSKQIPPAHTHEGRIDNWLAMTGAVEKLK